MSQDENFPHDASYKAIFSSPEMVQSLLEDFIGGPAVAELDFATLEPCPASYVTEDMERRQNDLVWRVKWKGNWFYIYILLEFQRSHEHFMALRICEYTCLFLEHLVEQGAVGPDGKLPGVFPIVVYNGEKPWRAPLEMRTLIGPVPEGLEKSQPQQSYWLVDLKRLPVEMLAEANGPVKYVADAERAGSGDELVAVASEFNSRFASLPGCSFRERILMWMQLKLKKIDPSYYANELEKEGAGCMLADVLEAHRQKMLQELEDRAGDIKREARDEGRSEGLTEGIALGRDEGITLGRDEGIRLGRDEGIRLGRDEGIRVGRDEGRRLGRSEGRTEGMMRERHERIIQAQTTLARQLRLRFGDVDAALERKIAKVVDPGQLDMLADAIIKTSSPGEFERSVDEISRPEGRL